MRFSTRHPTGLERMKMTLAGKNDESKETLDVVACGNGCRHHHRITMLS